VVIGVNGERFVGTVMEETTDTIVFESELGGRLTLRRAQIREIECTALPAAPVASTNTQAVNALDWIPSASVLDGFDWIQLKSGEWLKGHLKYVQEKTVEFDSDELEEMTLKLKDVRKIYTAKRMDVKFEGREGVRGLVVVSNDVVIVEGPEPLELPRDDLTGITPGGRREIKNWSGKATVGLNLQSGNTKETTLNTSAELARRTPATDFEVDYLNNYSQVNGLQNANNDRVNAAFDVRLNRRWFVRPVLFEYYHDPLANIGMRITAGFGLGYDIFNSDDLEWSVTAGPSYQYTKFETVEPGQSDSSTTPAGVLQSKFKWDITNRIKLILQYGGMVTSREAGEYTHHEVNTLEFEIKHHLNLDVSFVWDYLRRPQTEDDGTVPATSDYRLTLGLGARF
jgi:putative salt-induced outer membrane protein YdiY